MRQPGKVYLLVDSALSLSTLLVLWIDLLNYGVIRVSYPFRWLLWLPWPLQAPAVYAGYRYHIIAFMVKGALGITAFIPLLLFRGPGERPSGVKNVPWLVFPVLFSLLLLSLLVESGTAYLTITKLKKVMTVLVSFGFPAGIAAVIHSNYQKKGLVIAAEILTIAGYCINVIGWNLPAGAVTI
jgi:hypothetical protein